MARWSRRGVVEAGVASELPTETGERLLAATRDADGRQLVGSDRALYVPAEGGWHRTPWQRIDHATWDRESEALVVVEVADYGQPQPRYEFAMADPGQFLELVRERVTASVLGTRHFPLPDGEWLQVIARRAPVADGEVDWSVRLADSLDPSDPSVLRLVDQALADARDELGV